MYRIKDLKGVNGSITFDSKGSAPKYVSMFQVNDGRLKLVEGVDF